MLKRIFILALCLCLLVGAIPVKAVSEDKISQVCQDIVDDYADILRHTNLRSLGGWCGLMASWQMYLLGVNSWVVGHHGKDQYDTYENVSVTSGGHRAKAYSAKEYTLYEALNAASKNGSLDVYNILVGFQKTNTALGSVYGHSLIIYAILDGTVYYTEGYNTPFGRAGVPYKVSIEEFVKYYNEWTVFEGLVVFGRKGYIANCTEYATNMYAEANTPAQLYSQPCLPGTEEADSKALRTVPVGERLWINALWQNPEGELYYQVDDSHEAGYIPAEAVTPFHFVYEDIRITNAGNPVDMQVGQTCPITGRIASEYSTMGAVRMEVTDTQGNVVLNHGLAKLSGVYDLESDTFSRTVKFSYLSEGNYIYNIYADGLNFYVRDGEIVTDYKQIHLVESVFRVGNVEKYALPSEQEAESVRDGWVWQDGTWYCYKQGAPRTGWYCYNGMDYYLKEDGCVTSGWIEINGKMRFFSNTGCMRTGWIQTDAGKLYLMSNGAPAVGKRTIDGTEYIFDQQGLLQEA